MNSPQKVPGILLRCLAMGFLFGLLLVALMGCGDEELQPGPVPDPISLDAPETCDVCGMVIARHRGPNGQIYYVDHKPDGHSNPARFDSLRQGLFPYYFDHRRLGWEARVIYVTDYSKVGVETREVNGTPYIQGSTAPETFVDARKAYLVVDSRVHGAMGPEFIPFSDRSDARQFADRYGGTIRTLSEITPDMLQDRRTSRPK